MPQYDDIRGLSSTASSEASAEALFLAIRHFMTYRSDTMDRLDAVIAMDPDCPAALILKGFLVLFARSLSRVSEAMHLHDRVAARAELLNPREGLHLQALGHWCRGDLRAAQAVLDSIVTDYPRDILALRIQHMNAIFFGSPDILRATISRALGDWDDDVPGAGFVYGMACMGLEEVGEYRRAEDLGKRGVRLEPDDLWSVHSVAHVMEAEGRLDDGIAWMRRPDSYWEGRSPMRHHLWWHEAVFLYEAADYDRLLAYYDDRLLPTGKPGYLEMSNSASLLFRLEAAGVSCGERWNSLVESCAHLAEDRALTFSDVHMLVALGMAERGSALERLAMDLSDYAGRDGSFDQEAAFRISLPVAKAMRGRLAGNFNTATEALLGARMDFAYMGGSIAQRDMLDILLLDSARRAGRTRLARRLLNEYRDRRPASVPMQRLAESLSETG